MVSTKLRWNIVNSIQSICIKKYICFWRYSMGLNLSERYNSWNLDKAKGSFKVATPIWLSQQEWCSLILSIQSVTWVKRVDHCFWMHRYELTFWELRNLETQSFFYYCVRNFNREINKTYKDINVGASRSNCH